MKHSKKTLALRARYSTLREWIIHNLSADQFDVAFRSPKGESSFAEDDPLSARAVGVALWQAYRDEILFVIEEELGTSKDYAKLRPSRDLHALVCHIAVRWVVVVYAHKGIVLMADVVERQRREIADASALAPARQSEHPPRL